MAKPYNPLAALSPKQQSAQARAYVNAQIMPLLAQLNAEFNKRAVSGRAGIGQYTETLASRLAPLAAQTHDIYAQAQGAQSAADTALANRLTAAGASLGNEVAGKLATAGLTTPNNAAALGAGAAAAGQGVGTAALSALIGRGAAAENYASSLPGLARLGGQQQQQLYGAQLENQRGQQESDLRSKIPGLTQQILSDIQNRELQKGLAVQSGLVDTAKLNQAGAIASSKANQAAANAQEKHRHNLATENAAIVRNDIAKYNATHPSARTLTPAQQAQRRTDALEAVQVLKHGKANPHFNPTPGTPDAPVKYHNGVPDTTKWLPGPDGKPLKPGRITPRQAYHYLRNHGVPPDLADWAVGRVYGPWRAPGEGGRGPSGTGPR